MSGYTVVSEGAGVSHRCVTPDPDFVTLSKGAVIECYCGQRWRLKYNGWLWVRWERVEEYRGGVGE